MYIEAPAMYIRDCTECKAYFYFDNKVQVDVLGNKVCRAKGQEPNCSMCDKYDPETGMVWPGFTQNNEKLFSMFLMCRAFKKLPYNGGMLDQEPLLMSFMLLLSTIFETGAEIKDKNFQIELAKHSMLR